MRLRRSATPEEKRAYRRAYCAANKDRIRARQRAYNEAHKEEIGAQRASYRAAHREERSAATRAYYAAHRKERIAYTVVFKRVRKEQKAARPKPAICEVCGRPPNGPGLHFDHDHETGHFRGWLCGQCNRALGFVGDSPAILRALADYLENGVPRNNNGKTEPRP